MPLRYKGGKIAERRTQAAARVMQWARAIVGEDENIGVSLSANECGHAACAGEETTILLMRTDEPTVGIKIAKPLETVTEADVATALQSALSLVRG